MVKKSQIIFMDGKERALKSLFVGENCPFGYLAVGYQQEDDTGFEDPSSSSDITESGFKELENVNDYKRIKLQLNSESTTQDPDTGKVLVKVEGTLETTNIAGPQKINQIAIVNTEEVGADTVYYSATSFPTFQKTSESSITFVLGFRY